ncbi:MAG: histidinol dehydrogenase, partial [Clostridia bacterium]|nr:histidinol dehydrogenase [Clostridia bacterium]
VENIIMTTPPDKDGRVPDVILAAAKLAGVSRIVRLGGAQAVAALAFGTQSIPRVDKIVGPGNVYVATAKQRAYALGLCDIDMVAGPSEIMVIADEHNDPEIVAADLLSQAEHDKLASSWLVTTSAALADAVTAALEKQIPRLSRADIARASIDSNGRIMLVQRLSDAVKIANEIAPEHLEVAVDDPFALLPLLRNAGSIFLGRHTPEPLGDYLAGPNHTLPTSGTARYSSPLGVDDFCKRSSYLYYSAEALQKVERDVIRFANSEGLTAHAEAVAVRMRKGAQDQ